MDKNQKLITALDLQNPPWRFSRCRAYDIMNDPELPVIKIGRKKYVQADTFEKWLKAKARKGGRNDA